MRDEVLEWRRCYGYMRDAIGRTIEDRDTSDPEWEQKERTAAAIAANEWAEAHGLSRRITAADVERVETTALGHVDYVPKLAMRIADFLFGADGTA